MQGIQYQFAYHVSQIAKLLYLGQTAKISRYVVKLDRSMQEQLKPWLAYILPNEYGSDIDFSSDSFRDYQASAMGWHAYYQHDYVVAHKYFLQAIQHDNWQHYALNSALGLAKVYTRTGHWQSARDWCLYYLSLARQHSYHFEIAKGYGALAEIFLRASCANEALACFQTAYHLMPLGQGQQARQYNFMASALLRNKEILRAEVLLHTSRQISRNIIDLEPSHQDALASLCHSTMRFHYLNLLQFAGDERAVVNQNDEKLMEHIDAGNSLTAVPLGLLHVAKGIALLKHDRTQAASWFAKAMQSFGPKLVMEYQWASGLQAACLAQPKTQKSAAVRAVCELQPAEPPPFDVVLDQTWQGVQLTNQGFQPLLQAQTPEQMAELWTLFFI